MTIRRRVFVGPLHHEGELSSNDAYVVVSEDPLRIAYWQEWVAGLRGQHVRVVIESFASERELRNHEIRLAIETGNCPRCSSEIVHEGEHERDSSGDHHRCPTQECGWSYGEMESWGLEDRR